MTLATEVLAHAGEWGHHGGWWPIFPILWIVSFIAFAVFMASRRRRYCGPGHGTHSGEGVLSERYAKGEIDEDEYRKRLEVLKQERKS